MTYLPYFDHLLEAFQSGDLKTEGMWGTNVHYGYWEHPQEATGTSFDIHTATRRMNELLYSRLALAPEMHVLDVGCGFGGTLLQINEKFSHLNLVGLNIDSRQIERANKRIPKKSNNRISFIQGDACELPFPNHSFDRLLAVECAFHFSSRLKFLQEVKRVLKPGGKLIVSDFLFPPLIKPTVHRLMNQIWWFKLWGTFHSITLSEYQSLFKKTGFHNFEYQDITPQTNPHYRPMIKHMSAHPNNNLSCYRSLQSNLIFQMVKRAGWMKYFILEAQT